MFIEVGMMTQVAMNLGQWASLKWSRCWCPVSLYLYWSVFCCWLFTCVDDATRQLLQPGCHPRPRGVNTARRQSSPTPPSVRTLVRICTPWQYLVHQPVCLLAEIAHAGSAGSGVVPRLLPAQAYPRLQCR